jgi:hypothetical protein
MQQVRPKWFWRWGTTLRITVHRPEFSLTRKHNVSERRCIFPCCLSPIQPGVRCLYGCYMAWDVQQLSLALSKGPSRVGVSLPLFRDGNRSSYRDAMFSRYLQFRTMDEVQKPSDSECSRYSKNLYTICLIQCSISNRLYIQLLAPHLNIVQDISTSMSRDSSISTLLSYGLDGRGSIPRNGKRFFSIP